jgi:hypothetical protein
MHTSARVAEQLCAAGGAGADGQRLEPAGQELGHCRAGRGHERAISDRWEL